MILFGFDSNKWCALCEEIACIILQLELNPLNFARMQQGTSQDVRGTVEIASIEENQLNQRAEARGRQAFGKRQN
jgi:hypothetical protein